MTSCINRWTVQPWAPHQVRYEPTSLCDTTKNDFQSTARRACQSTEDMMITIFLSASQRTRAKVPREVKQPALGSTIYMRKRGEWITPFLDTRVTKENGGEGAVSFSTAAYRKPTFTGQYPRWDSFSAKKFKLNLIKCLRNRAMKICSPNKFQEEVQEIRNIFEKNGYPPCVVEKVLGQVLSPKPRKHGPKPCPVFLRLHRIDTRPSE